MIQIYKKQKGITLIALVITIVILLILAGVTLRLLFKEDGIIAKTQIASFITEMQAIQENVELKKTEVNFLNLGNETSIPLFSNNVKITDNLPNTLKQEILYIRNGMPSDKNPTDFNAADFSTLLQPSETDGSISTLWIIDVETANNKPNTYIYDEKSDVCFKIKPTTISGNTYHSYQYLTLKKSNGESDLITQESFESYDNGYYEPDFKGFDSDDTYIVYYSENILTTNDDVTTTLKPLKQYISEGKPRTITINNVNYIAYDYANKIWANAVTKSNGIESWWVWMPRYSYTISTETSNTMNILFVTTDDKVIQIENNKTTLKNLSEYPDYFVHPGFNVDGNKLQGIWMSKFNASYQNAGVNTEDANNLCYSPDMSGFDVNNTNMVYYSPDFSKTYQMSLDEYNSKNSPRIISYDNETYTLYDYANKTWANIVTNANGVEAWWVWIPRYAYSTNIVPTDFSIIFVDENDKPIDKEKYGNNLPDNYIVHSGFNVEGKKLKGIWMSKFNASYQNSGVNTESANNLCYSPDMDGFDTDNTYMVYYSPDFSKTYQMSLKEYNSKNAPRTISYENETYTLYDYADKIWANIVTKAHNIEAWWVWIPRYAYSTNIVPTDFSIIFVDENDKPIDKEKYGNNLPDNYIVHPGFNIDNNKLKGIWMSKFNATQVADPTE